jgi:hypothetical protein
VLLFPYGDPGWHYGLQLWNLDRTRQQTRLKQQVFYQYYLPVRSFFSLLFCASRLFQQYIVDVYVACETTALTWLRTNPQIVEDLLTSDEVTAIIPDEYTAVIRRDLILAVHERGQDRPQICTVDVTHATYMPLHYVLLFLHRDPGWHYGLQLRNDNGTRQRTRLKQRVFYRHYLHIRSSFSPLFCASRLFQQYIVDAYVACETTALPAEHSRGRLYRARKRLHPRHLQAKLSFYGVTN